MTAEVDPHSGHDVLNFPMKHIGHDRIYSLAGLGTFFGAIGYRANDAMMTTILECADAQGHTA